MFVTLITDCQDDNALGRLTTRLSTLFNCHITTIGVGSDLEAAGNLIDTLDASIGEKGIVIVNVAPRHKEAKKWPNGTPFGYFFYKQTLVISSVDGLTLSLVKKFGLTDQIKLMDIPTIVSTLVENGAIIKDLAGHITHTQFRSFEFLPRVAKWLSDGTQIPTSDFPILRSSVSPDTIWWIDNFGNCKTTLLSTDLNFSAGKKINTKFGELTCYNRLKDVPDDQPALIIGSSGLEERFLEIVVQGQSAAKLLNIKSGDLITF